MPEQCQHYTRTGVLSQRRCTRQATKDGYCTRHHPNYAAPRQERALEEWDGPHTRNVAPPKPDPARKEEYVPFLNGFVRGNIGVFPGWSGSWKVYENVAGEWIPCKPLLLAEKEGIDCDPDIYADPRCRHWKRSRDEVIEEAKRLADNFMNLSR